MRSVAIAALLGCPAAFAQPSPPCEADTCLADPPKRPWVLSDDCRDENDVVGYRHCATFGQWGSPAREIQLVLGAGIGIRRATAASAPVASRTVVDGGRTPGSDVIATSDFRVTAAKRGFYGGIEVEIGDLTRRAYHYGGFLQGGALLGVEAPVGPFELGVEALVAGRSTRRGSVDHPATPPDLAPVVEVRARVDVWLSPWLTMGGVLGSGLLDRSEWIGAVVVGFHSRAFGGER